MNFLFILLLSISLQTIGTGVLYLLCFVSVRIFSGGFHAKTHMRCSLAMVIWYLMFCVLNVFLAAADWKILSIGTLLAYVPLIRYAPVPNGNRPLSRIKRRKCRGRTVSVYTLWVLLAAFFTSFGVWTGTVFFFALWMVQC